MMSRPGFALLISLLMVMALAAVGAAMLAMATHEAEVAAAMTERSRARASAEAATRAALVGWSTRRHRTLSRGDAVVVEGSGGADTTVVVRRVDATLFLVEAAVRIPRHPFPAAVRAIALVRTLDTEPISAGFRAAVMVESEAVIHRGQVSGGDACGRQPAVAGVMAPTVVVDSEAVVSGAPGIAIEELPALPSAELFVSPFVEHLATITLPGGSVSPRPEAGAGGCVPDSLNWGAVAVASPCHDHLPLIRSSADLEVRGGEGRGLLVVDGDLVLDGFLFHGILLVRGRVTVGQGTAIRGAVRAGGLTLLDGSLAYDACGLEDASTSGGLDGPFRPGERWWLPAF
jgi:hypothetical protein